MSIASGRYGVNSGCFTNLHELPPAFTCHEWPLEEKYQETSFVADRAIEWLSRQNATRPFFLHVGFAGPHSPIEPLPRFMDLYRDSDEPPAVENEADAPRTAPARRGYRAMISQIDHQVGLIVDCVRERYGLENTMFVFTADHGEMAGDHGRFGKTCFFDPSVRVPLLLSGPAINADRVSPALVELIDIGRTICDLCGVEPHGLDQGRSLLPVLQGRSETHRDTVYAEMGCDRMLFDGRHKLMWGDPALDTRRLGRLHVDKPVDIPPSPARLYDLESDPAECTDLARSEKGLLHAMMEKLMIRTNQNVQTRIYRDRGRYRPLEFS